MSTPPPSLAQLGRRALPLLGELTSPRIENRAAPGARNHWYATLPDFRREDLMESGSGHRIFERRVGGILPLPKGAAFAKAPAGAADTCASTINEDVEVVMARELLAGIV